MLITGRQQAWIETVQGHDHQNLLVHTGIVEGESDTFLVCQGGGVTAAGVALSVSHPLLCWVWLIVRMYGDETMMAFEGHSYLHFYCCLQAWRSESHSVSNRSSVRRR